MEQSASIASLAAALFKVVAEVGPVKRTTKNPFYGSMYADLANVIDVIKKPLADNKLLLIQTPEVIDGKTGVTTMLYHVESNEWVKSTFSVTPKDPSNPQVLGSIITYVRRYSIPGLVMVASEDDDDGNSATEAKKDEKKEEKKPEAKGGPITKGQKDFISTLFKKAKYETEADKLAYATGVVDHEVTAIEQLSSKEGHQLIEALRSLTTS